MIDILIALLLGILAGTFAGLMPGIHINLIGLLLLTISSFLLNYMSPFSLAIFVIAMAISQTFLDFVPSIFLGAPEEETALSILPGHELLLKGHGYAAVKLALKGCLVALFLILLITPIFILGLPKFYPILKQNMALVLIAASVFLILKEKDKFLAFVFFMLSGILGIATLNIATLKQPLFPLLSGLFGISLLCISFSKNVKIPKQKIETSSISRKENAKVLGASIIAGSLCSFLPGVGASQAAVLGNEVAGKLSKKGFLVLLGATNMIVMGLSFVALYAIGKTRTGAAVIIDKLLGGFSLGNLILFLAIMIAVGFISYFLGCYFARIFAANIGRINYKYLCLGVIAFIFIFTLFLSSWIGLLVLLVATCLGIASSLAGIKKMFLMGCLLLPTILYFL